MLENLKVKKKLANKDIFKSQKGITLIALVITIVLNCSSAAMAWMNKNRYKIKKNKPHV